MRFLPRVCLTAVVVTVCLQLDTSAAAAQIPAVLYGRIEDAVTRAPLADVRVSTPDSSVFVLTDTTGAFSIEVADRSGITVLVERYGYVADRFDLTEDEVSRVTVLLLEPDPLELAGVDIEAQTALDAVLVQLENRRNIYPYAVRAYDGTDFTESTAFGSAWEFLYARLPKLYECTHSRSGLCIGDPPHSFTNLGDRPDITPYSGPAPQVAVCIDGHESVLAVQELRTLGIGSVALLEIYREGREGVRVYTADYLRFAARMGGVYIPPTHSWSPRGRMSC